MRDHLKNLAGTWPLDIPFERAVRARVDELRELIGAGMTWKTIASELTSAGLRKKGGLPMTGRQMNTVFLRVCNSVNNSAVRRVSPYSATIASRADIKDEPRRLLASATAEGATLIKYPSPPIPLKSRSPPLSSQILATNEDLAQRLSDARRLKDARKSNFED